jgi:glycoprotein 3-alpha-L-fucosyltransferase
MPNVLVGTTALDSDVPVPYYSWAEYNYMNPVQPKTATAMMAVFISNCASPKRLTILQDLMKYGVTIHSYGRCMKNADLPTSVAGSYLDVKTQVTSTYKFTFAAENSETDDYVTEKLFGTLCSGSVPVYLGAPNVAKFAPAPKSIINVSSFASTKELADFLIDLARNDTKYNEYLEWKTIGPSNDFIARVDKAIVHSLCRLCIKTADYHRVYYGNKVGHEIKRTDIEPDELALQVRPRGEFYMKYVYLKPEEQNLETLYRKVVDLYKDHDPAVGQVYSIYRLWDKLERPIYNEDFRNNILENNEELEIIFTYPLHPERKSYYKWQLAQLSNN